MPDPQSPTIRSRRRIDRDDIVVLAIVLVPYVWLAKRFWFLCDDSFVSFRYARNWIEGHGLRYNLGDHAPVEGYSNFLWVIWTGMIDFLGGDITFWVPFSSFLAGVVLLVLVYHAFRTHFSHHPVLGALTVGSLALFPPFAVWSTGGLATLPFTLLLFLTFERLILRKEGPAPIAAGLIALAMSLIRAEGIGWAVLLGLVTLVSLRMRKKDERWPRSALRTLMIYFGILAVGYGAYLVWRNGYYGNLVATSTLAKVSITWASLQRGVDYVAVYFLSFLTPFLLLPVVWAAFGRRHRPVAVPMFVVALAAIAYSIVVSGDFMAMFRFLVIGAPFGALLFGLLLLRLWGAFHASAARIVLCLAAVGTLAVGLAPAFDYHLVPENVRARFHYRHNTDQYQSEYEFWQLMTRTVRFFSELGTETKDHSLPGDSCVLPVIGAMGYYSDLYIYDQHGLVTPDVARLPSHPVDTVSPGHDKFAPIPFFLDKRPTFVHIGKVPRETLPVAVRQLLSQSANMVSAGHYYVPIFHRVDDGRYLLLLRRLETPSRYQGIIETISQQIGSGRY